MNETLSSILSSLPVCLCLFWWIILRLRRNTLSSPAHKHLAWLVFDFLVLCFCQVAYFNGEEAAWVRVLYVPSNLLVYPLLWLYVRALTEPERLKARARWVLVLPLLMGIVLAVIVLCGGSGHELDLPFRTLYLVELILTSVFTVRRLTSFEHRVENFYVDTEHKSLKDLRVLFFVLIPMSVLSFIIGIVGRDHFTDRLLWMISSLVFSGLLFGLFHVGFLLEYTAAEMVAAEPEAPALEEEPDDRARKALMQRVQRLMEPHRMYLTPGLKISDLAEALETNRTYISACINRETGMSFSDYVNGFRVRYAQELMRQKDPDLTLSQIGVRSGFSGDTSFFRNFRKVTGQTPSEWLAGRSS